MSEFAEVVKKLNRIEQLLVLLTKVHLAPLLREEMADSRMAELYELTGSNSRREINKRLNMSATTISEAWKRWERLGLLIKEGKEYRRII